MPYINLIQDQRTVSRTRENQARFGFYALGAIAGLAFLSYGSLLVKTQVAARNYSDIQEQLKHIQPSLNEIEANKKLEGELEPRLQSLEDAQKMTDRWTRIFQHFGVQTPPGVWLTSFRAVGIDPTQPVMLTLAGAAKNQESIGEFIERTQNQTDLDNVRLGFTQEQKTERGVNYQFELGAELTGTAAPKLAGVKQ